MTPGKRRKSAEGTPAALTLPTCSRCGKGLGEFLTLEEAARCLTVSVKTMGFWVYRAREIPVTHVGRLSRVLHADLETKIRRPDEPLQVQLERIGVRLTRPRSYGQPVAHVELDRSHFPDHWPSRVEATTVVDIANSLTMKDAAARLGVAPYKLYEFLSKGRLPQLRVFDPGLGLRVPVDAIEDARPVLEQLLAEPPSPHALRAAAAKARKAAEQAQRVEKARQRQEKKRKAGK